MQELENPVNGHSAGADDREFVRAVRARMNYGEAVVRSLVDQNILKQYGRLPSEITRREYLISQTSIQALGVALLPAGADGWKAVRRG
jgi:hypothetical protein